MKCKKCGNEIKDENKFCIYCGKSINENVSANESKSNNKIESHSKMKLYYDDNEPRTIVNVDNIKRRKVKKKRSLLFGIISYVSFMGILIMITKYINSNDYKKYISFRMDKISTIYGALGDKEKICSYSSSFKGLDDKTIVEYCDGVLDTEQLEEYEEYLIDKEEFNLENDSKVKVLRKKSIDAYYEIKVSIDYNNAIITYERVHITNNNVNNGDNLGNLEA